MTGTLRQAGWDAAMGYPGVDLRGYLFSSEDLPGHWEALDEFEGEAYERRLTEVKLEDGSTVDAYVYTLRPPRET